ncbi:uncharacterized protein SETTUDRAFT_30174 [Exserohilum turcica Et28A]|uniref:Uncharacterized protein n=1 Tax=Exserohilum turcicum (strain 28A) TaxID=671987 RepID=R0KFR4_EXST2|nr:uncharacterized protein SETTUDRAFT_30174 [Exserohilum turcica Et28A]EOA91653.1 hypothetical protein SETTUDRAFT_30174 [Exserohilum turcica Et28A]
MAPDTARHADVKEKQQISHIEDTGIPAESELASSQETHAEGVDINNTHALKGDASEGKVQWSTRSILAAMCLAGLVYRFVNSKPLQHSKFAPLTKPPGSQIILYFTRGSLRFIEQNLGSCSTRRSPDSARTPRLSCWRVVSLDDGLRRRPGRHPRRATSASCCFSAAWRDSRPPPLLIVPAATLAMLMLSRCADYLGRGALAFDSLRSVGGCIGSSVY